MERGEMKMRSHASARFRWITFILHKERGRGRQRGREAAHRIKAAALFRSFTPPPEAKNEDKTRRRRRGRHHRMTSRVVTARAAADPPRPLDREPSASLRVLSWSTDRRVWGGAELDPDDPKPTSPVSPHT